MRRRYRATGVPANLHPRAGASLEELVRETVVADVQGKRLELLDDLVDRRRERRSGDCGSGASSCFCVPIRSPHKNGDGEGH